MSDSMQHKRNQGYLLRWLPAPSPCKVCLGKCLPVLRLACLLESTALKRNRQPVDGLLVDYCDAQKHKAKVKRWEDEEQDEEPIVLAVEAHLSEVRA